MYTKVTEAYEGKNIVTKPLDLQKITEQGKKFLFLTNYEFFKKTNVQKEEKDDYVFFVPNDEKGEKLLQSYYGKQIISTLENENKKDIINLIIEDQKNNFENTNKDLEKLIEAVQKIGTNYMEWRNGKKDAKVINDSELPIHIKEIVKNTPEYNEINENNSLTNGDIKLEDDVKVRATLLKLFLNERNIEYYQEYVDTFFTRIKVDFEQQKIEKYNCKTKIAGMDTKNFEPWEYDLEEEKYDEISFKEIKRKILIEGVKTELNDVEKNLFESYMQKKETNLEDAKIINEIFINSSLLLTLEFVLQNELIKEVVEIKKTVNVNASKKKKKKKNTEKNSYLVIDSEKLKKILIEAKEKNKKDKKDFQKKVI